jgi:predicted dienelactone hydrolase
METKDDDGTARNRGMNFRTALASIAAAALILATPAAAHIAGERHLTADEPSAAVRNADHSPTLRITVWYPTTDTAHPEPIDIGPPGQPLFRVGDAAPNAPFAPGRRRPVILLSHGFGGTARMMGWFGVPLAQDGYIVISVDHPGNNGRDRMTVPGAILPWERAEDLKLALRTVGNDTAIGPHMDLTRLAAAGFSAGGFTALVLGGAKANPNRLMAFCDRNPNDGLCRPQVEFTVTKADRTQALQDPEVAASEARAEDDHSLASIKAIFAMAPALIQGIQPHSLEAIGRPVSIVAGDADTVAAPASNAQVAAHLVPNAKLDLVPGVGHYAFLSTCTPAGLAKAKICKLAGPQEAAHRLAIARAEDLFSRTLLKPDASTR